MRAAVRVLATLAVAIGMFAQAYAQAPARIEVIHEFVSTAEGGPVALAGNGSLLGFSSSGGRRPFGFAFELAPPTAGQTWWTIHKLSAFFPRLGDGPQAFAIIPNGGLAVVMGELFGGEPYGGAIVKLTPPTSGVGRWTSSVAYQFAANDPASGPVGVWASQSGVLYGVSRGSTSSYGGVFVLVPAAGSPSGFTRRVLHWLDAATGYFPNGQLLPDGNGGFYGSTYMGGGGNCQFGNGKTANSGCGVIFHITPGVAPGRRWTYQVLYAFQNRGDGGLPVANLALDAAGNIYGMTSASRHLGISAAAQGHLRATRRYGLPASAARRRRIILDVDDAGHATQ